MVCDLMVFFFFKQKTAYEMRISDWSSDVCSSDLVIATGRWSIGGGDLPSGTLSIARNEDGRVTGLASFEPYSAEGARLALTPVRFSGGAGGLLHFATTEIGKAHV